MMLINGPPKKFLSRFCLIAMFAAGVAACAPASRHGDQDGWVKSRPPGAAMPSYRPAEDTLTNPAVRGAPDEPAGILTLREALAQALSKNPELAGPVASTATELGYWS